MSPEPPLLLFVCSGNICRSPFAEAAARDRLGAAGVEVASAGTFMIDGKPPPPEAVEVAAELGLDLAGHRSRGATRGLVARADRVYGMDASHLGEVEELVPGAAIELLDPTGAEIADPYGLPLSTYREAYRRILGAVERRLPQWIALRARD